MEKSDIDKIIKLVDEFVASLKKELLATEVPSKGILPGVWDKMKNWWYNLTKGKNSPENPYMYQHKFGALGQQQESKRLSLSEYKFIKECYDSLESSLNVLNEETEGDSENIKKLKLFKIIDSWAEKFKKAILIQFGVSNTETPKPQEKPVEQPASSNSSTSSASADNTGNTGADSGRMPTIPDKNDSDEEKSGAGRPAPLVVNWSDKKKRFIVRDQIDGRTKVRGLKLDKILPISEIVKINVRTIEAAAENSLKLSVYQKLISQLPDSDRQVTGYGEDRVEFEVNQKLFDEKFTKALQEVLKETSQEFEGKGRTTGDKLHKKIVKSIYFKLDPEFADRADLWMQQNRGEEIDLILGDLKS